MADVRIAEPALEQIERLPLRLQARLENIVDRLERWPEVSGAKPLRGDMKNCYRIRTGDYRVIFAVEDDVVTILRVGHRKDVYEE